MPPITVCSLEVGSKIKEMSLIPGWQPLPSVGQLAAGDSTNDETDTTILLPTQTAVMLAEMADANATFNQTLGNTTLNRTLSENVPPSLSSKAILDRSALDNTTVKQAVFTKVTECVGKKDGIKKVMGNKDVPETAACLEQPSGFFEAVRIIISDLRQYMFCYLL